MQTNSSPIDREAVALAACYRLLLQKARERRERLAAREAAAVTNNQEPENQEVKNGNGCD